MHLYLGQNPRTIYLVAGPQDERQGKPSKALVFRAAEANEAQVTVEFLLRKEVQLGNTVPLTNRVVKGCLGLISVDSDTFLAVVTSATELGNTRPAVSSPECVGKIHEVLFFCLTSSTWDDFSGSSDTLLNPDMADNMMSRDNYAGNNTQSVFEHPCLPLTKILSSGSFYYALHPHWDISSRLATRLTRDRHSKTDLSTFDPRFIWNEYIVRSLLDFRERLDPLEREDLDKCQFIVR